jgi:glucose-6-phosphate 1-dehydrogenase
MTTATDRDVMVIFGITGDLARKMTFASLYRLEARGKLSTPIVGVAFEDLDDEALRTRMRDSVSATVDDADPSVIGRLASRLRYVGGDFTAATTYERLREVLAPTPRRLYYLEVPPALFAPVIQSLAKAGLASDSLFLIEKPFGHDLASARELNAALHAVISEEQILRVDHFLGKLPVLDVYYLRFANAIFEPLWSRAHVSQILVSMTEDFGVEDRGSFYDPVGALRDVVQNHLLQVLGFVLMEPPSEPGDDGLWSKKVDVFKAMRTIDPKEVVRGQYQGYQEVKGVAPGSRTETYIAMRLAVDSWRWSGVPIFLRAGKALARTSTEVRLVFRHPPKVNFLELPPRSAPNQLVLRIDPTPGLRLTALSRGADGTGYAPVHLDLPFTQELGRPPEPYERLLEEAMAGRRSLFAREDVVEETWRVVNDILVSDAAPLSYEPGTWGPVEANELLRGHLGWQEPWLDPIAAP